MSLKSKRELLEVVRPQIPESEQSLKSKKCWMSLHLPLDTIGNMRSVF